MHTWYGHRASNSWWLVLQITRSQHEDEHNASKPYSVSDHFIIKSEQLWHCKNS